jgi:hypothetical protein
MILIAFYSSYACVYHTRQRFQEILEILEIRGTTCLATVNVHNHLVSGADTELHTHVARVAQQRGVLCNVVICHLLEERSAGLREVHIGHVLSVNGHGLVPLDLQPSADNSGAHQTPNRRVTSAGAVA